MIARPDVDTLLAGPLGAWLGEQALARRQAKMLAAKRWSTAALFGLPFLAFIWVLMPFFFQFNLVLTFLVVGGGYAWGNAPRRKAIKSVKIGINEAIASALELDYAHDVDPGGAFELARRYDLLPHFDRSKFEDLWHGEIDGRSFALHEAELKQKRGSGKNRRYVTVFKGAVMNFDFAREFHGTTLVERAGQHLSFLRLGARKDSVTFEGHQLDYVDLVHPDFEDDFCVYSDDQVEARYLVHPEYVERLMAVQHAFEGKNIRALFSGGDLVVAIETGDMFESGSIEARDDRFRIEQTVEQFASLADLAQSLNEPERGYRTA